MSQKARLNQRRVLAQNRRDEKEVAAATKELEELERKHPELLNTNRGIEASDRTAGVNERNRKAAVESRRAQEDADREARRKRTTLAAVAAAGDVSRPATPPIKDLSARVKTVPKIIHENNSRCVVCANTCREWVVSRFTICSLTWRLTLENTRPIFSLHTHTRTRSRYI